MDKETSSKMILQSNLSQSNEDNGCGKDRKRPSKKFR
jgi:hypothetical protein